MLPHLELHNGNELVFSVTLAFFWRLSNVIIDNECLPRDSEIYLMTLTHIVCWSAVRDDCRDNDIDFALSLLLFGPNSVWPIAMSYHSRSRSMQVGVFAV